MILIRKKNIIKIAIKFFTKILNNKIKFNLLQIDDISEFFLNLKEIKNFEVDTFKSFLNKIIYQIVNVIIYKLVLNYFPQRFNEGSSKFRGWLDRIIEKNLDMMSRRNDLYFENSRKGYKNYDSIKDARLYLESIFTNANNLNIVIFEEQREEIITKAKKKQQFQPSVEKPKYKSKKPKKMKKQPEAPITS